MAEKNMIHRFTSAYGIEFIKNFEGFSPNIYKCPAGYATIGYGHVLRDDELIDAISYEEAEHLLVQDLYYAERSVLRNITTTLSDSQFDALVSFTFNLGSAALQRSTLRQKINSRADIADLEGEFLKWVYAGSIKLPGLINRRQAEYNLYSHGL